MHCISLAFIVFLNLNKLLNIKKTEIIGAIVPHVVKFDFNFFILVQRV